MERTIQMANYRLISLALTLSNAGSIERQFSIYERIQTKIAFTRCQEA
nr:hypothetical protein [Escherichia coli]